MLTFLSQQNPRSTAIKAVAKANNIDLEIVDTDPVKGVDAEYFNVNKLGKIPTFVGADGYTLHEAIAIAIYSTSIQFYYSCPLPSPAMMSFYLHTVIPVLIIRVDIY